jgi:cytidine deaminase
MAAESKTFESRYELHQDEDSLPIPLRQLLKEAKQALLNAHAPYSQFNVGAAVLLASGKIVWGSNQENMAYPSGLCAERVAFFSVGAQFPNQKIIAVAISVKANQFLVDEPLAPCGACRQSMLEFELKQGDPITIVMQGETGSIAVLESVKSLLPFYFLEERLKG